MLHVSALRQTSTMLRGYSAPLTLYNWGLHIRNLTGCILLLYNLLQYARPPLGTLQLSHFLQQIFARIYKQNSKTYLQQKYLPPPATATDQILTGNHFYNSLPKPLLWWHPVVKLFRSSPQIPIHFVFFVAFLGHRLLAVFWCFCEALAVA